MLKNLLSLFLQSVCPLCQRSTNGDICQFCQKQILQCKLQHPSQFWQGDLPVFAWGIYQGHLKRAIATFKYNNHPQLGELMGYWLGKAWLDSTLHTQAKNLIVVPIPLHPDRLQNRGFNQAEVITRSFCQCTGYSWRSQGLERVHSTQAMFGLTKKQRQQNLSGAFSLGKDFQHNQVPVCSVLLIDDIYTTGTTVREAAKVLRSHNIKVFGVAALSIVPSP